MIISLTNSSYLANCDLFLYSGNLISLIYEKNILLAHSRCKKSSAVERLFVMYISAKTSPNECALSLPLMSSNESVMNPIYGVNVLIS